MDTQIKPFSEWEDKELIDYAKSLNDSINNIECYGVNDCIWLEAICQELYKRGYEIIERTYLEILKEESDE
jgi:hypothetical protein